jgi:hypothetical protein
MTGLIDTARYRDQVHPVQCGPPPFTRCPWGVKSLSVSRFTVSVPDFADAFDFDFRTVLFFIMYIS